MTQATGHAPDHPIPDLSRPEIPRLGPAEVGALAHLYRAEVYRCTVWRSRLDTTTNWSIVTLVLALSLMIGRSHVRTTVIGETRMPWSS